MQKAEEIANDSYCLRKKVGCVIVRDNVILADGRNGTIPGYPNVCEDNEGNTKWNVLHAEFNAILKIAKSTNTTVGSIIYITLAPCKECAKMIIGAEIKKVVYKELYRDSTGLEELKKVGIEVVQI